MFRGKKYKESAKLIDRSVQYDPTEALNLVVKGASAKFDETVEIHIKLGVDSRHADQQVRGAVVLPNGTGKTRRVLVFAKDAKVEIYEKKTVDDVVWGRTSKGWICLKYVKTESVEPAETVIAKGTVNTDDVKIRSTPDTGAIVGTYKTGDKVSFFEKKTAGSAEWGRTDKGWVCLLYVTME